MKQFIDLTADDVRSGAWYEETLHEWKKEKFVLPRIVPKPTGDLELRKAVENMLDSNGSYNSGDRAVIHARYSSLDMACETALALMDRRIKPEIILSLTELGQELHGLVQAVLGTNDTKHANQNGLARLIDSYKLILQDASSGNNGHWIVTSGTSPDPNDEHRHSIGLYTKARNEGLAGLSDLRETGAIKSHDIWFYPTELDVRRLREGCPMNQHLNLQELREIIFLSTSVSSQELERKALEIPAVRLTIEASLRGGTLLYKREDGTKLTYRVDDRPVILDCGRIGNNALGGTISLYERITNQPTTEVFVAPIENSADGVIVCTTQARTQYGIIESPYKIFVKNGRVSKVEAPTKDSTRILQEYTGLMPLFNNRIDGDNLKAFKKRRIIAEVAIAGFNPVMEKYIRSGELRSCIGLALIDEKVGDHVACGANGVFGGTTSSRTGTMRYPVIHTDFVGTIDRYVKLIR